MEITKNTRILVIDDFEAMRKVTSGQLRRMGAVHIYQAKDGAEALKILQQQSIDLILSDWNMPVMTGLELLIAVRANPQLHQIPFIMITAEADRDHVVEAIAHGVNELLVKPYSAGGLADRIKKVSEWKPHKIMPADLVPDVAEELPTQLQIQDDAPTSESPITEPYRPTILVVDDNTDNVELLYQLFKNEYRVRITLSGERAVEICTSDTPPDLVLLDIMMPFMDGFEVAEKMREHPISENIPIIFVTAMEGKEAHEKGLALGAVDFVSKPIDPYLLVPRVRNFMRYIRLHKQLQADYDTLQENARLRESVEHITRHDIKGPLAGVIGTIQLLAEQGSLTATQCEQLQLAEDAALQMLNMINLSTELYKIEAGNFTLNTQPVKIMDILRKIAALARTTFNAKKLTISVNSDSENTNRAIPQSAGDAMLCYSLFQNLIKNACEAAPEETDIEVILYNDNPLKITIQNSGAVPREIRNHFFGKFVTYGKTGGSGLGTYSARLLAEAQQGSISLDVFDDKNQTLITVLLPKYNSAH